MALSSTMLGDNDTVFTDDACIQRCPLERRRLHAMRLSSATIPATLWRFLDDNGDRQWGFLRRRCLEKMTLSWTTPETHDAFSNDEAGTMKLSRKTMPVNNDAFLKDAAYKRWRILVQWRLRKKALSFSPSYRNDFSFWVHVNIAWMSQNCYRPTHKIHNADFKNSAFFFTNTSR